MFYSEYYEGGYIDHVTNFSEKSDYLSKINSNEAIKEIVYRGNNVREKYDIRERLKCFCMQKSVQKDVKDDCKKRIENYFTFDDEQRKIAKQKAETLTDCEKYYLYQELQDNFHAPRDGFATIYALGYDIDSFYQ